MMNSLVPRVTFGGIVPWFVIGTLSPLGKASINSEELSIAISVAVQTVPCLTAGRADTEPIS